jgi:hypothetical protein
VHTGEASEAIQNFGKGVTALAAGLALIPIALGAGQPGSEIQAPMAYVILFGLLSSTFLNMFVLPAAWWMRHAVRNIQPSFWQPRKSRDQNWTRSIVCKMRA